MAAIKRVIDADKDLTVFVVVGELTAEEVFRAVESFYADDPTGLVLWDLSNGSTAAISAADIRWIVRASAGMVGKRQQGKTALVGAKDAQYGLARMYGTFAEIQGLPAQYMSFRTRAEAEQWLGLAAETRQEV
jgi:hypothetical protein